MSKNITLTVAVDRETEDKLMEISAKTGKGVSSLIREAIIEWLEADKRG